jgi:hypothetical protein
MDGIYDAELAPQCILTLDVHSACADWNFSEYT